MISCWPVGGLFWNVNVNKENFLVCNVRYSQAYFWVVAWGCIHVIENWCSWLAGSGISCLLIFGWHGCCLTLANCGEVPSQIKPKFNHHLILKANFSSPKMCSGARRSTRYVGTTESFILCQPTLHMVCVCVTCAVHFSVIGFMLKQRSLFSLSWFQGKLRLRLDV